MITWQLPRLVVFPSLITGLTTDIISDCRGWTRFVDLIVFWFEFPNAEGETEVDILAIYPLWLSVAATLIVVVETDCLITEGWEVGLCETTGNVSILLALERREEAWTWVELFEAV